MTWARVRGWGGAPALQQAAALPSLSWGAGAAAAPVAAAGHGVRHCPSPSKDPQAACTAHPQAVVSDPADPAVPFLLQPAPISPGMLPELPGRRHQCTQPVTDTQCIEAARETQCASPSAHPAAGAGPVLVAAIISNLGREAAFNISTAGWIPCGLLLMCTGACGCSADVFLPRRRPLLVAPSAAPSLC